MQNMTAAQAEALTTATEIASRRLAGGATIAHLPQMFSDSVTEDIYAAHPELDLLRAQLATSTQADIDDHMAGREFDVMEMLNGPASDRTRQLKAELAAAWARTLRVQL